MWNVIDTRFKLRQMLSVYVFKAIKLHIYVYLNDKIVIKIYKELDDYRI